MFHSQVDKDKDIEGNSQKDILETNGRFCFMFYAFTVLFHH